MSEIDESLPADASVWERDLLTHLTSHVQIERMMLETYVAASQASGSKALAYVVELLIEDEKRHHMMFRALAATLVHDANFKPGDPEIPRLDFDQVDAPSVRGLTAELMGREVQDLVELRKLAKELREVKDTTLWGLLVDLMLRDTEKHIAMLEFVEDHL